MQGVKYFLILRSLMEANQLCFVFVWFSCFHYFVLKGITRFSLETLFEIPHLYQIPQCVQAFHVSNLLRPWKCNVWKLTPPKFQFMASQLSCNRMPTCPFETELAMQWNVSLEAASCFVWTVYKYSLVFFFPFFVLNTFLVHWLQKPTRNYAMGYCFFLFFFFLF